MIGQLLDGRYQVIRALSAGGFGQTFIAQDIRRPGSPVCIVKHLKPASNDSRSLKIAKRLFQSEAEILEQLGDHNQIPRLLAYFEENKEFYLVQEFVEGHPLTQELRIGQRWPENRAIELLQDVLAILLFLHSKGAIHRDIKPDNIIRRKSDRKLVLVDFGAVKQVRTHIVASPGETTATIAVGTPGYMPSEQGQGKPRPSSDIYALGVVAIQSVTGLRPYQIKDDPETGELLWQQYARISPELTAILSKMVRCYFKERYTTVTEVLQALQQLDYTPTPSATTFRYSSLQGTEGTEDIPTKFAPASTYGTPTKASAGSVPSNGNSASNPVLAGRKALSAQPHSNSQGHSVQKVHSVEPIHLEQRINSGRPISTQNQLTKPTYLQNSRVVLAKALRIAGWGAIMLTLSTGVLFWSKRIHPPTASSFPVPATAKPSATVKPSQEVERSSARPLPVNRPFPDSNPLPSPISSSDTTSSNDSSSTSDQRSSDPRPRPAANPPSNSASPPSTSSSPTATSPDQGADILARAQQEAGGGNLLDAITIAQTIPSSSSVYSAAQQSIGQWQDKLSSDSCQSSYDPGSSSSNAGSDNRSGKIAFTNGTDKSVRVTLYRPDAPNRIFQTWNVGPGENLSLGEKTYGVNWGIQVDCSAIHSIGEVSDWNLIEGAYVFQTSADKIL
jgi:serine/threonine protein kinase